uniref:RAP1 GTPase activating protein n=1 Tax=Macaca fascicularis TaxID=9541 RepID=A0A7N9DF11_MACFA
MLNMPATRQRSLPNWRSGRAQPSWRHSMRNCAKPKASLPAPTPILEAPVAVWMSVTVV